MELDILNEIVSSTVGDLFRFQSKYNILAAPLPKPISTNYAVANSGGIKNLVLKQQQLQQSQQNLAQQQQQQYQLNSQEILPVQSSLSIANQNIRQQQQQQQQPLLSKGNTNVLQILGSNSSNILENNNNKRVSASQQSSLNSSLANAQLLDQSSISQLNISKDTITTKGSISSLNTSLQNIKNNDGQVIKPEGFLRDSTNIIRTSSSSFSAAPLSSQFENPQQGQFNQQSQQLQHPRNQIQNINNLNNQKNYQQHIQVPYQGSENDYSGYQQSISSAGFQPSSNFTAQTQPKAIFNNNFINNENKIQNQQIRYSENDWIKIEAPKKLEESMQRLQLDQQKISMRAIKEMNYKQLQIEKKRVKNELKLYDQAFEDYFHTQPERNQKEPMRPLYVYYKGLKQALSKLPVNNENDRPTNGQKQTVGNNIFQGQQNFSKSSENGNITSMSIGQSAQTSVTTGLSSHQSSFGDNSLELHAATTGVGAKQYLRQSQPLTQLQQNNQQQLIQRGSNISDAQNNRNDFLKSNNNNTQNRLYQPQVLDKPQISSLGSLNNRPANNFSNQLSNQHQLNAQQQTSYQVQLQQQQQSQNQQVLAQAVVIEQKISAMKKKRGILRDQLQVYQDEFYKTHNRKIKYHKDVLPVEREYKEYKELKKEIVKLEQQQNQLMPGNKGTKEILDNSVNEQNQCGFDF